MTHPQARQECSYNHCAHLLYGRAHNRSAEDTVILTFL